MQAQATDDGWGEGGEWGAGDDRADDADCGGDDNPYQALFPGCYDAGDDEGDALPFKMTAAPSKVHTEQVRRQVGL